MKPISCHACGNRVLVEKYSPIHTSVQWLQDPAAACPELGEAGVAAGGTALVPTCHRLRASIVAADRAGELPETTYAEPGPLPADLLDVPAAAR